MRYFIKELCRSGAQKRSLWPRCCI